MQISRKMSPKRDEILLRHQNLRSISAGIHFSFQYCTSEHEIRHLQTLIYLLSANPRVIGNSNIIQKHKLINSRKVSGFFFQEIYSTIK